MRRTLQPIRWAMCAGVLWLAGSGSALAQVSMQSLSFSANIGPSTSLRVSDSQLRIGPSSGGGPVVVGTIAFEAHARTYTGGEVVLSVEALREISHLAGGASGSPILIEYGGTAPGVVSGILATEPRTAGRWVGSGSRTGSLTFVMRGPEYVPGGVIPLRFVLSAP